MNNHATLTDGRTLSPLQDYVIIKPEDSWTDDTGVVLPPNYNDDTHGNEGDQIRERNKLCLGIVQAVGPGEWRWDDGISPWRKPPPVEPGELVMYERAAAVRVDDREHEASLVLLKEESVFLSVPPDVRQVLGGLVTDEVAPRRRRDLARIDAAIEAPIPWKERA